MDEDGEACVFKAKDRKFVQSQLTKVLQSHSHDSPTMIEMFSPNRFAEAASQCGIVSRAFFNLSDGWHWGNQDLRKQAEHAIRVIEPDLSIMCPPYGPLSQ